MSESLKDLVSVVIPTRNRPDIASKAVKSALAQTFKSIEVIVVLDGPDEATVNELKQIEDPRLRVIELPVNGGAARARNIGVKEAKGNWIAFLDDDDEWLPEKIERQLELAHQSPYTFPVISCRFIADTSEGKSIWPKRLPAPSEPISEYLFLRNTLFVGEAFLAIPTVLSRKELLENVPLKENLPRHEDFDWFVRVGVIEGVGFEFVPEPMAILNVKYTRKRKSLSNINNWQYSLDWINSVRELVTPRAYSAFVTTVVSYQAASEQNFRAFFPLLWKAIRFGKPRLFDFLLYLSMWLIPRDFRQVVRSIFDRNPQKTAQ